MALSDNLISYWPLNEASGNALDVHGSNELTESSTVGTATGVITNARDFELSENDYFYKASNSDLSPGNADFTFQAWVKLESNSAGQMRIIDKYDYTNNKREYTLIWYSSANTFQWAVSSNGTGDTEQVDASGTASLSTWYLLHVWHDSVNNLIGISVNAGTAVTKSYSSGIYQSNCDFCIGRVSTGYFWDGLICEAALWHRVLTSDERTALYNAGAGLAYPFTTSSGGIIYPAPRVITSRWHPAYTD